MKCDFIYLDWNVVKALKEKIVNPLFPVAISTLKKQFIFPFSFAHLCDRQKNMSKENMMLIKADLEFFDRLCHEDMSVKQWCKEHSITVANYYYRLREVPKECLTPQ